MTRIRLSRIFWIGAAAILVAAALVALVAVIRGDSNGTNGQILATLAAVLLAGSTLVAGLALVERGGPALGWTAVAVSPPAFAAIAYSTWAVGGSGEGEIWRWGWAGILALLSTLIAVTARLLARSPTLCRLAWLAGALATVAATTSYVALWRDDPDDTIGRIVAVLWILAGLAYLLVPVLQRFTAAGAEPAADRVIAELDGIELVATGSMDGLVVDVQPGERLVLRRRT